MSGKWLHRPSQDAQFYVPHFFDPRELDELRPYLPTTEVPKAMQNVLHTFPQSVPRELGKPLIQKMLNFWTQSESAYQAVASRLDNSHYIIADQDQFKYATLNEIAERLLPSNILRKKDGTYSIPALYAVHRSLLRGDIGFRSQTRGTLRAGGQYEIRPRNEIITVARVKGWVRDYQEWQITKNIVGKNEPKGAAILRRFSAKAQSLIDRTRQSRQLTSRGTVGPSSTISTNGKDMQYGIKGPKFEFDELEIIRFIESWSALDSFAFHSTLNGIGSTILRITERYDILDLGPSTAWTFLQEIGAIAPWENRAAFELRLIGGRHLSSSADVDSNAQGYIDDSMQSLRKDWGNLAVYCIDDPGAHEIDDGISIESTNNTDEFWVHVHTADPAAHIHPEGAVAKYAQSLTSTVYMPERVVSMLPRDFVASKLSLAPDRPCLTFSAKMNLKGDILEYNITAGRIHIVHFLTPSTLNELALEREASQPQEVVHRVGQVIPPSTPSRPLTMSHQIDDATKAELRILQSIGKARSEQLKAKGGIFQANTGHSISVSFNGTSLYDKQIERLKAANSSYNYPGDPSVEIRSHMMDLESNNLPPSQNDIVRTFMLVAGEVAARWCNERGIPIPFRVTPRNPDNIDPGEFYKQNVLPTMDKDGNPNIIQLAAYYKLLGVQPSIIPGPHVGIGVDMMAKCTSPLRRYGDLLLQWQVEAALLEESRSGNSLVGNRKDTFLPFSKDEVAAFLPHLDTRERLIAYGSRQAERHWLCHFLVRAWLFKETEIPAKLLFIVGGVDHSKGLVFGNLPTFLAGAICELPDDPSFVNIKEGDRLEVELEDVNVFSRSIRVKALRHLDIDIPHMEGV